MLSPRTMALVPDAIFLLDASSENLVDRTLDSRGRLDYWESGMDVGFARDWYDSFMEYQRRIRAQFDTLTARHAIQHIDGNRSILEIHDDIRERVAGILTGAPAL